MIGYRQPPKEWRFKKGQSGNPRGRPPNRKVAALGVCTKSGIINRIAETVWAEGERRITVRDGDLVEDITAFQALTRSAFRLGACGDSEALRLLFGVLSSTEANRLAVNQEALETAHRQRVDGFALIEKHWREKLPEPEIYPHPCDILIDERDGSVTIDGPIDKRQADATQASLSLIVQKLGEYEDVSEKLKLSPKDRKLKQQLAALQTYKNKYEQMCRCNARRRALEKSFEHGEKLAKAKRKPVRRSRVKGEVV